MAIFLGTNFGHGSAVAALSSSGDLLCAVEEGKLINEKDSARFPECGIQWALQDTENQKIVGWSEGWKPLSRLLFKGFGTTLRYGWSDESYWKQRLAREFSRYIDWTRHLARWAIHLGPVNFIGHHLAHAYSLLPAGLPDNSIVIVSDTTGERDSVSLFYWSGQEMTALAQSRFPHSIGGAFHRLAHHFGFYGRTGPGKLMALSAYGEPRWLDKLQALSRVVGGQVLLNLKLYPAWHKTESWLALASNLAMGDLKREIIKCRNNHYEGLNLAASAQAWFAELTWLCALQGRTLVKRKFNRDVGHLGLVGGSALNCQANGEIIKRASLAGFDSVTLSPWSSDPGTAIGAAVGGFLRKRLQAPVKPCGPFLGPNVGELACTLPADAIEEAVQALVSGDVIALVSGRLEFGPRALGGRCLLADARDSRMRDTLNRIKSRPEFMPFAPAVLREDFGRYFKGYGSRHMAWTVDALPYANRTIPAAVHLNGTSRVQVVDASEAPVLDRVLRAFRVRTGHGVLLLTSLNGSGEAFPAHLPTAQRVAEKLGAAGVLTDKGWAGLLNPERIQRCKV